MQLFVSIHNPPSIQVVWAQLNSHTISWQNPDEVLAHPSGDMSQHLMIVLEFYLEHGVWQRLQDGCHDLNRIFL